MFGARCIPFLRASKLAIVTAAAVLSMSACTPFGAGTQRDVTVNGIHFDKLRENADGTKIGELAADTDIDGYPCRKGFVAFHADGRLDECHLARGHQSNGIVLPAGTRVFPDKRSSPGIVLFPHEVVVQGYPCRGTRAGGFMTAFYPNGRLHWFFTKDPQRVGDVTCADSLFQAIYLHPDGSLQQCKLDAAATINGVTYRKGDVIHLDPEGRVQRR